MQCLYASWDYTNKFHLEIATMNRIDDISNVYNPRARI